MTSRAGKPVHFLRVAPQAPKALAVVVTCYVTVNASAGQGAVVRAAACSR